jgi:RNA polymerase sigma-70 factor (ECF subfamily)
MMTSQETEFVDEVLPHLAALQGAARRLGRDPEDLVQETYLHALEAQRSYRRGSNARAWLYRILHNVAMTEHRKRARDQRLEAKVLAEPVPEQPSERPRLDADVLAALDSLSPPDRRVVELADLEGLRYRDLARILECPLGTVMSRLHRARRRLRARLTTSTEAVPTDRPGSTVAPATDRPLRAMEPSPARPPLRPRQARTASRRARPGSAAAPPAPSRSCTG